jgi:hypothetical protein
MEFWITLIFSFIGSILASTGLWAFIQKRMDKKDNRSKMLVGLGHDRIVELGMKYIRRGWITKDEYENLYDYLYAPYHDMGGNGSAERIMKEVDRLPIRDNTYEKKKSGRNPKGTTRTDSDGE